MPNLLNSLSAFSILVPLSIAIYKYDKLKADLKILGFFFLFSSVIELTLDVLAQKKMNNLWLINIYTVTEGFIFCYLIGRWSDSNRIYKLAMILFTGYFLYWLYSIYMEGNFYSLNGKEKTIKALVLIFLSSYFLVLLSLKETVNLVEDYRFWIACGIMLYFSVTLVVFCTESFLLDSRSASYYSWIIHSIANIMSNLLFAYGFIWYYRRKNFST